MSILRKFFKSVKGIFKGKKRRKKPAKKRKVLRNSTKKKKTAKKRVGAAALKGVTKKKTAKKKKLVKKKTAKKKKVKIPVKKKTVKVKKSVRGVKKKVGKSKKSPKINQLLIGQITHYFSKIHVGVLKVQKTSILIGDQISVRGKTTDFTQRVASLQIESKDVKMGRKGQLVGLQLSKPVKVGDKVFKAK